MSNVYLSSFRLKAPCPVTTHPCEKSLFLFLVGSLLFSRLKNPNFFGLSPQERCSCSQIIFVARLWTCSHRPMSFLCWGPQNWTQHSGGVSQEQSRGAEPPPSIAGHNPFLAVQYTTGFLGCKCTLMTHFIFTLLVSCK